MKTHISEIEKLGKTNKSEIQNFQAETVDDRSTPVSRSSYEAIVRRLGTEEARIKEQDQCRPTTGNCFICDPDWCPEYRKRSCQGKRLG